jgi:hypothetical protein
VDWQRSFYLNLICHTEFSLTVAICRYVDLCILVIIGSDLPGCGRVFFSSIAGLQLFSTLGSLQVSIVIKNCKVHRLSMFKVGLGVGHGAPNAVLAAVSIGVLLLCSLPLPLSLQLASKIYILFAPFAVDNDCKIEIKISLHLCNLYIEWPRGFTLLLVVLIFKAILDPRYVSSDTNARFLCLV